MRLTCSPNFDRSEFHEMIQESFNLDEEEAMTIVCLINLHSGRKDDGWKPLLARLLKHKSLNPPTNFFYLLLQKLDLKKLKKCGNTTLEKNLTLFISHSLKDEKADCNGLFTTIYEILKEQSLNSKNATPKELFEQQSESIKSLIRFVYDLLVGNREEVFQTMFQGDVSGLLSLFAGIKKSQPSALKLQSSALKPLPSGSIDKSFPQLEDSPIIDLESQKSQRRQSSRFRSSEAIENSNSDHLNHDVKLIKTLVFVSLADLDCIKAKENLQIREKIIETIVQEECFGFIKIDTLERNKNLIKLLFGILSWDIALILESLKTQETFRAYLLVYSVVVLFNFKYTSKGTKGTNEVCLHEAIIFLLGGVFKSLFPTLLTIEGGKFQSLNLEHHFEKMKDGLDGKLDNMHTRLLEFINLTKTKKGISACRFKLLKNSLNRERTKWKITEEEIPTEFIYQMFTGSITTTLLDLTAERVNSEPEQEDHHKEEVKQSDPNKIVLKKRGRSKMISIRKTNRKKIRSKEFLT